MYYLIGSLVSLIGILVAINHFRISQENKRIDDLENNFFKNCENNADDLENLRRSGINNLKDDKEIKRGLERIKNRIETPRLWVWNPEIEKVGYKKFFQEAGHSDLTNPKTVLNIITKIKNDN